MSFAQKIDPVIDRLGRVLDDGHLPHPYDRWGARLLDHLTKPVQVVVTGFAGTGKTALIEMLSGCPVLGPGAKAPIIELVQGATEQVIIERNDGSVSSVAGVLKGSPCPEDALRIRQEVPAERLSANDFVEIGLYGELAAKRTTLGAAIERADIVLWCTQEFNAEEQALWASVPDALKDHSLLIVTMADQQLMRGVLDDTIARLDPIVAQEFLGLYPVATIQGITAQTSADTVNEALWASSGGKHLVELLARQVRQGRNADYDQARIFMERLAHRIPQSTAATDLNPQSPPGAAEPALITPEAPPAVTETQELECNPEALAILTDAVDLLQQHSLRMLREMDARAEFDPDRILSDCTEAIQSVSELLHSATDTAPAQMTVLGDVEDGEEMLMLFQLERGEDAALDAVTLMLQLRKELAQKLAS